MRNRTPQVYDLETTTKKARYVSGRKMSMYSNNGRPLGLINMDECKRLAFVRVVINLTRTPAADSVIKDYHPASTGKLLEKFGAFWIVFFFYLFIIREFGVLGLVAIVLESRDIKAILDLLPADVFYLGDSNVLIPVLWSPPGSWIGVYVGKGSGAISRGRKVGQLLYRQLNTMWKYDGRITLHVTQWMRLTEQTSLVKETGAGRWSCRRTPKMNR